MISPHEKRVMNYTQDGEASSMADRSREHMEPDPASEENRALARIERALVSTYLFSFEDT